MRLPAQTPRPSLTITLNYKINELTLDRLKNNLIIKIKILPEGTADRIRIERTSKYVQNRKHCRHDR